MPISLSSRKMCSKQILIYRTCWQKLITALMKIKLQKGQRSYTVVHNTLTKFWSSNLSWRMLLFIFCRVKRCISFLAFAGVGLYQPFIFDIKTNRHRGLKRRWSFNHEKITCGPEPSSNIIHLPIMSEPSKLSSYSKKWWVGFHSTPKSLLLTGWPLKSVFENMNYHLGRYWVDHLPPR